MTRTASASWARTGQGTGEHFGVQDGDRPVFRHIRKGLRRNRRGDGGGRGRGGVHPLQRPHERLCQGAPARVREDHREGADRRRMTPSRGRGCGASRSCFRIGLVDLGYDIGETESPITPVYVPSGDEKSAMGDDLAAPRAVRRVRFRGHVPRGAAAAWFFSA